MTAAGAAGLDRLNEGHPATQPNRIARAVARVRGWLHEGDTSVVGRDLDHKDWRQMRRLAEACNDQDMAVSAIYEDVGVCSAQRFSLRTRR